MGRTLSVVLLAAAALLVIIPTALLAFGSPDAFAVLSAGDSVDPSPPDRASAAQFPAVPGCGDEEMRWSRPTEPVTLDQSALEVNYRVPQALSLEVLQGTAYVSFRDVSSSEAGVRGVEISDVSNALLHGSLLFRPYLGTDASTFLSDLNNTPEYDVIALEPGRVGADHPAIRAKVRPGQLEGYGWTHIDRLENDDRGCSLEFAIPHQLLVTDVGDKTIAVQIWAASEAELDAWLPTAMSFVETFEFRAAP